MFLVENLVEKCGDKLSRAGIEGVGQIGNQIIDILNSDGDTDEILSQASSFSYCSRYACMRHETGQADERLHTSCRVKITDFRMDSKQPY